MTLCGIEDPVWNWVPRNLIFWAASHVSFATDEASSLDLLWPTRQWRNNPRRHW